MEAAGPGMPFLLFLGNDMKSIQLMSLVVLLALVPASAQAQNSGRKYGTYQGAAASSNPSNYGSEKAVPVTAPAVATGVAAPAAVTPGTPVAATTPVNTPAAAAPVATPVVGAPQTVPPVFQDTTAAAAGATPATAAAATPAAPPDACAGYMYDNNAYQSCKDMMLKIERMKAGSKARNASYQAQAPATAPAPAVAAPVAAVPVAAATPAEPAPATATTPDAATPATPATAPIMIIPGATKPVTPVQ